MPIYSRTCFQHKPKHPAPGFQLNDESLAWAKQLPHICQVDSGEHSANPKPYIFGVMQPEYKAVVDGCPRP